MENFIMKVQVPTESYNKRNISSMTVSMLAVMSEEELTDGDYRKLQSSRKVDIAAIEDNVIYMNCPLFVFSNFRDYANRIERESIKYQKIISNILNRDIQMTVFGVILDPLEVSDDITDFSEVYFKIENDIAAAEDDDHSISKVQIKLAKTIQNALALTKFMKRAIFTDCSYRFDEMCIYVEIGIYQRSFRTIQEFSEMLGVISNTVKWFEDTAITIVEVN